VLYHYRVEYDDFRGAVLELADGGARLTKGSVALRLKVEPASAGAMLDRMTRDGQLELDIDERSGEIFYEPRHPGERPRAFPDGHPGERPRAFPDGHPGERDPVEGKSALVELRKALDSPMRGALGTALVMARATGATSAMRGGLALPPERRRKLALGVVLGGLIPGLGLAYSAPWPVVLASSVVVLVGFKVLAIIPIFSSLLLIPFLTVCAIASAILGGLYAWRYNQTGKRSPIGDEPVSPKRLLKRILK
jgi:hypothetical protein